MSGGAGPLVGLRIVEFAGIGPAPFAAMLLADLGADIIRIDRPRTEGGSTAGVVLRGRPTVIADLKQLADRDAVLALTDQADALIEGFRPGVMERLGLGPDALLGRNPRLVYGRMTGWGQDGPLAKTAGHDIGYIAITGALAAIGPAEHPVPPLNLVGDYGGGSMYLVMGMLAGIISASQTGRGQVVDAAICDGAASLMAMFCDLTAQGRWQAGRQRNLLDGGAPFYRTFECADGQHLAVGAIEPQFYALLLDRLGLHGPDWDRADPAGWPALHERFAALFRTRDRADWCALLEGTDACVAPVLTLAEAPAHPHMAARGSYTTVAGTMHPAPAPRFSLTPGALRPSPPPLSLEEAVAGWAQAGSR